MIRFLVVALCVLVCACASPEEVVQSSIETYNRGHTQDAIAILHRASMDDYAVANTMAIFQISAGFYGHDAAALERADVILQRIPAPERNTREIGMYLALLKFLARSNAGQADRAKEVWVSYCGPFVQNQKYWDCLRLTYITAALITEGAFRPGTKLNRDLIVFAKSGYQKAYGWDPLVFRNRAEHEAFVQRSRELLRDQAPNL